MTRDAAAKKSRFRDAFDDRTCVKIEWSHTNLKMHVQFEAFLLFSGFATEFTVKYRRLPPTAHFLLWFVEHLEHCSVGDDLTDALCNELNCYDGSNSARFRLQADNVAALRAAPECGKVSPSAVTIDSCFGFLDCDDEQGGVNKRSVTSVKYLVVHICELPKNSRRRSAFFSPRNLASIFSKRFKVAISSNYIATPSF